MIFSSTLGSELYSTPVLCRMVGQLAFIFVTVPPYISYLKSSKKKSLVKRQFYETPDAIGTDYKKSRCSLRRDDISELLCNPNMWQESKNENNLQHIPPPTVKIADGTGAEMCW